jgi:hypothetical protein
MTDEFRAMCAELVDDLEMSDWPSKLKEAFRADSRWRKGLPTRNCGQCTTRCAESPATGHGFVITPALLSLSGATND